MNFILKKASDISILHVGVVAREGVFLNFLILN